MIEKMYKEWAEEILSEVVDNAITTVNGVSGTYGCPFKPGSKFVNHKQLVLIIAGNLKAGTEVLCHEAIEDSKVSVF
jgi:hypothetical protein